MRYCWLLLLLLLLLGVTLTWRASEGEWMGEGLSEKNGGLSRGFPLGPGAGILGCYAGIRRCYRVRVGPPSSCVAGDAIKSEVMDQERSWSWPLGDDAIKSA